MRTNVQVAIDQQRATYDYLRYPLLAQLAIIHGLTVRDFAAIFGISKSHSADVLNMRKAPDLILAIRIARYFEVSVDELFGWLVDDRGDRRPLVVELPGKVLVRLRRDVPAHRALELVKAVAEHLKEQANDIPGDRSGA